MRLRRKKKDQSEPLQRERIAWCGHCGNVSVDGINFRELAERPGWLQCAACGEWGPFSYRRELGPEDLA